MRGSPFCELLPKLTHAKRRFLYADQLRVPLPEWGRVKTRQKIHSHVHPEIFYQWSGCTLFRFPRKEFKLQEGQWLFLPSGFPHEEWAEGEGEDFGQLVLMLLGQQCQLHMGRKGSNPGEMSIESYQQWRVRDAQGYQFLAKSIGEGASPGLRFHLVQSLLEIALEDAVRSPHLQGISDPVARSIAMLHDQVGNKEFTVRSLAEMMEMSADHLSTLFRRDVGQSPKEVQLRARIDMAKRLLEEGHHRVSEVAQVCGFSSSAYFCRIFRERIGVSPRKYPFLNIGENKESDSSVRK